MPTNRREYITKKYNDLRLRCFDLISGFNVKCNCCDFPYHEFLEIDHVDPDYEKIKTYAMYNLIIKGQYYHRLQLLCSRCNKNKHRNTVCELDHSKDSWKISPA